MSRKKAIQATPRTVKEQKRGRPKGRSRTDAVFSVVATDDTFYDVYHSFNPDYDKPLGSTHRGWHGKCIHCNTTLSVARDGSTNATLEHIVPMCAGGSPDDPHNLALACQGCNNRKGIEHDQHVGKGGRADEVIESLRNKRAARWREPVQVQD